MRYLTLILLCLTAKMLTAQTMFNFTHYNTIRAGVVSPSVSVYTNSKLNEKLGFTNYFYVNGNPKNSWGQGMAGLSYSFTKSFTLGLMGGIQSNEAELGRICPFVMVNQSRFSLFGAFEFGGERYRWDVFSTYAVSKFKFGAEFIKYYKMCTFGPRFEFSFIKKQPINLFYSGMWDFTYGKYVSMAGFYSRFK